MPFKLNKDNFYFGEGTSPNKKSEISISDFLPRNPVTRDKETGKIKFQNPLGYDEDTHLAIKGFKDNLKYAMSGGPHLEIIDEYKDIYKNEFLPVWKDYQELKRQGKPQDKNAIYKYAQATKKLANNIKQMDKVSKQQNNKSREKIPALYTAERKAYYDKKNWRYDDTIKGYNKDGTKKK